MKARTEGPRRVWINQPSSFQEHYSLHGKVGITEQSESTDTFVRIYFCEGDILSMMINKRALIDKKE